MAADILSFNDLWQWFDAMNEAERDAIVKQIETAIERRPFESIERVLRFAPYEVVNRLWTAWANGYDLRVYQSVIAIAEVMAAVPDEIQKVVAENWIAKSGATAITALRTLQADERTKINKLRLKQDAIDVLNNAKNSAP